MTTRPRGHTLIELLVAMTVFMAVIAIGTDFLVHALRSTASGELRQTAVDECRGILYRISSEIRAADEILDPPWQALALQGSPYIVFSTRTGIVGYRLVSEGGVQVVRREMFYPGYTRGMPATQNVQSGSARTLTSTPSTLWFTMNAGSLPPGQGGVAPGQDGTPGGGIGLALGTQKLTVQVQLSVAPQNVTPIVMRTKKTLWAGLMPKPKETTANAAP